MPGVGRAGIDVVSREPIQPRIRFERAKNCLITPHIAWATEEADHDSWKQRSPTWRHSSPVRLSTW